MNPTQAGAPRPMPVTFELRAEEDRAATIAAGRAVMVDVEYATFMADGGRLKVEKRVRDFTPEARQLYGPALEAWRKGLEPPVDGTPIRGWTGCTPAQAQNLIHLGIMSVEDLRDGPEATLQRFGPGGVALRQKAKLYLEAADGPGKLAEQMTALQLRLDDLEAAVKEKDETIAQLQAAVQAGGGRRREKPQPATPAH
jgi:hypothetical protein